VASEQKSGNGNAICTFCFFFSSSFFFFSKKEEEEEVWRERRKR